MSDQTAELLLDEFRAFRDQEFREFVNSVAAWREESSGRLSALEVQAKDIIGNGRPGRMDDAEDDIQKLQQWQHWVLGISVGVSALVSIGAWIIVHIVH